MSEVWGTVPQWVSAGAACTGLMVAISASRSWKKSLKEKRTDDILTALIDFSSELGATRAAVKRQVAPSIYGDRIDSLYVSLRSLQKAYVLAQRSFELSDYNITSLHEFVLRTTDAAKVLKEKNQIMTDFDRADGSFENLQREWDGFARDVRITVADRPAYADLSLARLYDRCRSWILSDNSK